MHVLIVDDEPEIREYYGWMLEEAGHTTSQAGSGEDAVRYLEQHARPDVVVTDLLMPHGNGMQVLNAARARGIPFIVVSGFSDAYDMIIPDDALILTKGGQDVMRLAAAVAEVAATAEKMRA